MMTAKNEHDINKIFVYGTLKQGHGNDRYLRHATFLGRSAVYGAYDFYDLGSFPAVVQHGAKSNVHTCIIGEVYEVNTPTRTAVDMLEGHPHFFERIPVNTAFGQAWMYTFNEGTKVPDRWSRIQDVWRPTEEEQEFVEELTAGISSTVIEMR